MTTTTILSAVSFGTGSNTGNFFNPVKTTLQSATTAVLIAVQLTRGRGNVQLNNRIIVRHAVSPTSYSTAAIGAQVLQLAGNYVELPFLTSTDLSLERSSDVLVTAAGYHYCWVEAPNLTEAATITVKLQEIP